MTQIRAVACDLFGTLVHLPDPWFRRLAPKLLGVPARAWLSAVRRVGLRQSFSAVEELVSALAEQAGASQSQGQELLVQALREQVARAQLAPGAVSVLRFLRRRGLKLALVSNLSSAHARVLEDLGLLELFDVQLLSCNLGITKPSPEVFSRLSQELGLPPSQILVVGDSEASDGAARRLGFPVLLVGSQRLPRFFRLGWLSWEDPGFAPLLAEGQRLPLGLKTWRVERIEPLAEGQEGRYNLLATVVASCGEEEELFFCKRFWDPAAAYVDALARSLAQSLELPVPEAWVVEDGEPLGISQAVKGKPYTSPPNPEVAFDLGAHLAFAYAFANADIRPRNAFVTVDVKGRERLTLIDFEHCFLNLALPPELVAQSEAAGALARMTLVQARSLAKRQVITPKTIVRARNEFFPWREASAAVREAFAEGFSWCWERMQAHQEELLAPVRAALAHQPPLRVGTWRFRRRLALCDVEEMEFRLRQPLSEVLALFTRET